MDIAQTENSAAVDKSDSNALLDQREEMNALRNDLARISNEMGLPPGIGPAPGELRRMLDNGKVAIKLLYDAPRAVSAEADFEKQTWLFDIASDCAVGSGIYALVKVPNNQGKG